MKRRRFTNTALPVFSVGQNREENTPSPDSAFFEHEDISPKSTTSMTTKCESISPKSTTSMTKFAFRSHYHIFQSYHVIIWYNSHENLTKRAFKGANIAQNHSSGL